MNLKEIKEIIKLMNENNLTQIEIERDSAKIKISKGLLSEIGPAPSSNMPAIAAPVFPGKEPPSQNTAAPATVSNLKEIKAPMVGTFYRASSPDAPPFVEIGQVVEVGQVVCILEAMKLMNEIKSDVRGKIVDIKIQNAEPVEFGTVLFLIEPA